MNDYPPRSPSAPTSQQPVSSSLPEQYSSVAERAILAAILMAPSRIREVVDRLHPDHFYFEKHAQVYRAMQECYWDGHQPDMVTVLTKLRTNDRFQPNNAGMLLADILHDVTAVVQTDLIGQYATDVIRLALARKLVAVGAEIQKIAYQSGGQITEAVYQARRLLDTVAGEDPDGTLRHIGQVAGEVVDRVDAADHQTVLTTGLIDLDRLLVGLHPGDLVIVAARPGVGKTSLLLTILLTIAQQGVPTAFFSLEMPRTDVAQRLLAIHTGIAVRDIRALCTGTARSGHSGRGSASLIQVMVDGFATLSQYPIFIDDTPQLSPGRMRDRVRRNDTPIGAIFVDYLQLLEVSSAQDGKGRRLERRVDEITAISRELKLLARELNVPVIAASQLSRAVEQRADRMPKLSDLRDSGSIEQDADVVILLDREELYRPDTDRKGIATAIVAKHRNGPIGEVPLLYNAATTRFHNLARYPNVPNVTDS
jgi:replicative DNA helicase